MRSKIQSILLTLFLCSTLFAEDPKGTPILWRDPGNIASLDLFYGLGGREGLPEGPFTFLKEDLDGSNPKFDVVDSSGTRWKVKMGVEAGPEVAASRLMWAAGYFVSDCYLVSRLEVRNMPARLNRGQEMIAADGAIYGARLKRVAKHTKSLGPWRWRDNPFSNTREFNGLRVMMALLGNIDVKDDNNRIYRVKDPNSSELVNIYAVKDLGSSFSRHLWPPRHKGNLNSYIQDGFIKKVSRDTVNLSLPTGPMVVDPVMATWYLHRLRLRWIAKGIPRQDARWIGSLLGELSRNQIEDAFRAAGFTDPDIQGFTDEVLKRIEALKAL